MNELRPTAAQQTILQDKTHPELVFLGGVQSGKTELGAHWMTEKIIQWVARPNVGIGVFGVGVSTLIHARQRAGAAWSLAQHLADRLNTSEERILNTRSLKIDLRRIGLPAVIHTFSVEQGHVAKPPLQTYADHAQAVWLDEIGCCLSDRIYQHALAWVSGHWNDQPRTGQMLTTSGLYPAGAWLEAMKDAPDRAVVRSPTRDNPAITLETLTEQKSYLTDWFFRLLYEVQWPNDECLKELKAEWHGA